jgi:hypothetical protein
MTTMTTTESKLLRQQATCFTDLKAQYHKSITNYTEVDTFTKMELVDGSIIISYTNQDTIDLGYGWPEDEAPEVTEYDLDNDLKPIGALSAETIEDAFRRVFGSSDNMNRGFLTFEELYEESRELLPSLTPKTFKQVIITMKDARAIDIYQASNDCDAKREDLRIYRYGGMFYYAILIA